MKCKEESFIGDSYRKEYLNSIEKTIDLLYEKAEKKRKDFDFFEKVKTDGEKYREEFKKMLGYPLTEKISKKSDYEIEKVFCDEDMTVSRIKLFSPIGITYYGIYFEHTGKKNLPLTISQHGGLGTPELISGMLECGSCNYNDMVKRVFEKGVNVFAPQLLLWNKETFEPKEYDRIEIDKKLKQLGSSITAVEIYGIMKFIDVLSEFDSVDENKIGMYGLSYGGFYTLFTSAADTRIKSALACSQYNDRKKHAYTDWTWFNAANTFFDNEVACLVYPRYLCICVGDKDDLFDIDSAKEEFEKLREMTHGADNFDFYNFDGTHEFIKDDFYIDKFLEQLVK